MIRLYFWPTPNGYKISILLEELGLPYEVEAVHIGKGEQFGENFLRISPNNKIPAIVDSEGPDGKPFALFESAAIMMYLAEKGGFRFMPAEMGPRYRVAEWLAFQAASMAPALGQAHHFREYSKEKIPYAIDRFTSEAERLYRVLERRLSEREFLAGEYSIADMATYPWLRSHKFQGQNLDDYPSIQRWYSAVRERPGVQRGLAVLKERFEKNRKPPAGAAWDNLFGNKQFGRPSGGSSAQ
ncbi:GST-like protein [Bradyrhizobium sp. AZCC 1577]|uniref:glutathione S-transferase family protein n=1 Tax=Bradyrhizobium sp. AZCC 1577 TaxID=3117019 RepID=UPI002FEF7C14